MLDFLFCFFHKNLRSMRHNWDWNFILHKLGQIQHFVFLPLYHQRRNKMWKVQIECSIKTNLTWLIFYAIHNSNQQQRAREGQIFLRLHSFIWQQCIGIILPSRLKLFCLQWCSNSAQTVNQKCTENIQCSGANSNISQSKCLKQ